MSIIQAIILAIVEGLTEFLPISSTGHMIMVSAFTGIANDPFTKLFIVTIQFGAILAVVVLYWNRFFESLAFYYKLLIAFMPAAVIGLLFNSYIDFLLGRIEVVAITLIAGGIFFLFVDKMFSAQEKGGKTDINHISALKIGFCQTLAMIPGVSRSAATIIGGLSQKLNRKTATEFSFFLAVPTMFAASAYKLLEFYTAGYTFAEGEVSLLVIGNVLAFITAIIAIKSFIALLTRHGFKMFGYYRITVGGIILLLYLLDVGTITV